jgi:hypothetical protein
MNMVLSDDDHSLLIAYSVDSHTPRTEAIVEAFLAVNIDVYQKDTTIHDWIEATALDAFSWSTNQSLQISTRIWDHTVVITSDQIRIYTE